MLIGDIAPLFALPTDFAAGWDQVGGWVGGAGRGGVVGWAPAGAACTGEDCRWRAGCSKREHHGCVKMMQLMLGRKCVEGPHTPGSRGFAGLPPRLSRPTVGACLCPPWAGALAGQQRFGGAGRRLWRRPLPAALRHH